MKSETNRKHWIPIVLTILSLVGAVAYIAFRLANERAYRQKWKDYNDCGLA